jgi:hypothetical protein
MEIMKQKKPDIDKFIESFKFACKKYNIAAAVLVPDSSAIDGQMEDAKVKFRIEGSGTLVKIIHLGVQYFDLGIQKTKQKIEKPDILTQGKLAVKNFFS